MLEAFAKILNLIGYGALIASSGSEGVRAYERERPEITLLDLRMPDLDGWEVLRAILELDSEAEVILVTGHGDIETVAAEALRAGATAFIPKPVEVDVLECALERASERLRSRRD